MDIGGALRAAREERRLTQAEVAEAIGVTRQAIAALEANHGRVATLVRLAKLIRLRVSGVRRGNTIFEEVAAKRAKLGWSLRTASERSSLAVNTIRGLERGDGSTQAMAKLLTALAPSGRLSTYSPDRPPRDLVTVALPAHRERSKHDHYTTPLALVRLLLDKELLTTDHPILEPAVGQARTIDRVLRERGYRTACFDLNGHGSERKSFFELDEPYHTIITNPPWNLHLAFIHHAKQIATHKIVLLMPLNYLTGSTRYSGIWCDSAFPLARVYVLNRGVDFDKSDPQSETFAPAQIYMAWYIFERGHLGPPALAWLDNDALVQRKTVAHIAG